MEMKMILLLVIGSSAFVILLMFFLLLVILKLTPAFKWLKAKILRRPILFLYFKDSTMSIEVGGKREGNFSTIKGFGPFELQRGTGCLDQRTKVVVYNAITEHAATVSSWRAIILSQLKEMGFQIDKWADLNKILKASTNDEWVREEYSRLLQSNPKAADVFKRFVKYVRNNDVQVFFNKSFKFTELYNMFGDDFNPVTVEEARYNAIQKDRKKRNMDWMIFAIACATILMFGAIAYVMITRGKPEVIIKTVVDNATMITG